MPGAQTLAGVVMRAIYPQSEHAERLHLCLTRGLKRLPILCCHFLSRTLTEHFQRKERFKPRTWVTLQMSGHSKLESPWDSG